MNWFTKLPVQIQAALIGAVVTFTGILVRDFVFKLLQEKREKRKSTIGIYRKYADPLTSAATSLLWRFHEIFYVKGRADYLREAKSKYEQYKRISTFYRLASILGWIRAFRRELSTLQAYKIGQLEAVENAITAFESALADGPHVEIKRLEGLSELWGLKLPADDGIRATLAITLDNAILKKLDSTHVEQIEKFSEKEQVELCEESAMILCDYLKVKSLSFDVLKETQARAIQQIAIKQAWLFRDWQAGIGDLMIREAQHGERGFEVIGFRDFESMVLNGDDEEKRWLERITNMFDTLDVSVVDMYDARIQQLRNTMFAIAQIIRSLAQVKTGQHLVSKKTLETANQITADHLG